MNDLYSFATPQEADQPYTVSEINQGIATILESGNTLVWVEGEISNYKRASSGHIYLKLKDESGQIPAVIWRSNAAKLDFVPEDGVAVMVIASIRVYVRGGYYQLDIHKMQPAGVGALYAAFEKLKKKLEGEGLFDAIHKKPLPQTVHTLGVVTAKTGAAVRDIIKVVAKRSPQTTILLRPVAVQGDAAPPQIAAAIQEFNEHGKVDCIIVGRGGGSVEDLWAFNDERVVRAIFNSRIPIVSAVGHEIDFTIADFVSDVRAPTPSAAAEIVVADQREGQRYFLALAQRFTNGFQRYFAETRRSYEALARSMGIRRAGRAVSEARQAYDSLARSMGMRRALRSVADTRQTYRDIHDQAYRAMGEIIRTRKAGLSPAVSKLNALSPLGVLARGYSVVTTEDGKTVTSAKTLSAGANVRLQFHQGGASAVVKEVDNSGPGVLGGRAP